MNIFLTFDIEVWCNGWEKLDENFPHSFERYVYGRSVSGDYALPKTLEILNRNGLIGVFFVEPLFAARFGVQHLEHIVRLIRDAGHEIQLHLHPEWMDEISPPIIANCTVKRQHLSYYTLGEQTALIGFGKKLLEEAGSGHLNAFRAGSFAANMDTFEALRQNDILLDSSLNRCHSISGTELRDKFPLTAAFEISGVTTIPVTTFRDGFGRDRPAQVGACSFNELLGVLFDAKARGWKNFVIVSHNFEMLKPGTSIPDAIVVQRFEKLCAFLAENRDTFPTCGFASHQLETEADFPVMPRSSLVATGGRYLEQIRRRLDDLIGAR